MSSGALPPSDRPAGHPARDALVGLAAWGAVALVALPGRAAPPGWAPLAGGLLVGLLLAGGNVLLLRWLLRGPAGLAFLHRGFGRGVVWSSKLGVLGLLLWLSLGVLRLSPVALALGATVVVALVLASALRATRLNPPLPALPQGGEHARS